MGLKLVESNMINACYNPRSKRREHDSVGRRTGLLAFSERRVLNIVTPTEAVDRFALAITPAGVARTPLVPQSVLRAGSNRVA